VGQFPVGTPVPDHLYGGRNQSDCNAPTVCIGHPSSTTVMPDISHRASIFKFLRMDPRRQLGGMTTGKNPSFPRSLPSRLRAVALLRTSTKLGAGIQVLMESLGPLLCLTISASLRKTGTSHSMHVGNFGTFHRTDSILRAPRSSHPNDVLKRTFGLPSSCTSCTSRTSSLFSIGYEYLSLSLVC